MAPAAPLQALQIADLGAPLLQTLQISRKEPTRIAAEQGRIAALRVKDGVLVVEKDEDNGQLFISLTPAAAERSEAISAFITLDDGSTSTLTLQPADVPAETILLRKAVRTAPAYQPSATTHTQQAKRWMTALATGELPRGAQRHERHAPRQLVPELELVLDYELHDGPLRGERYTVRNHSAAQQQLDERLFYRPGVLAVALDSRILAPGEATAAYVLTERGRE